MECGPCTLCCELLPVGSINKPAGTLCLHCDKGCLVHEAKPEECKVFECAYFQMEKVSDDFRPDKCKIIFEKLSDRIFFGTIDPSFGLTDLAKGQIKSFVSQGFSVVTNIVGEKRRIIYPASDHVTKHIEAEFDNIIKSR